LSDAASACDCNTESNNGYPLDCKSASLIRFRSPGCEGLHMSLKILEMFRRYHGSRNNLWRFVSLPILRTHVLQGSLLSIVMSNGVRNHGHCRKTESNWRITFLLFVFARFLSKETIILHDSEMQQSHFCYYLQQWNEGRIGGAPASCIWQMIASPARESKWLKAAFQSFPCFHFRHNTSSWIVRYRSDREIRGDLSDCSGT
jgi:hypothetical protein